MRRWMVCGAVWVSGMALVACGDDGPIAPSLPDYGEIVTLSDHRELPIRFESGDAILSGTLLLPLAGTDFPTVAMNLGSSWTTRATWAEAGPFVQALNVGFFSYDKRGFGESSGDPVSTEPNAAFDQLADDLVAAARAIQNAPHVRGDRVGVLGSSQGGWVVPLAANRDRSTISYVASIVGGAVSTGQEGLYDVLTGYEVCERSELSLAEINDSLRAVGPSGFDPRASLEAIVQPTLWIYGGLDFSHPAQFSEELLADVEAVAEKPWTIVTIADANHEGIAGGSICQTTGPPADYITPFTNWMAQIFP